jgi:hypothetical protein
VGGSVALIGTSMAGCYIDVTLYRLNWRGDWDDGRDLALIRVSSESSKIRFDTVDKINPFAMYPRLLLGSTTATNCSTCATPYNSLQTVYGYGDTYQADESLGALHWGWVRVSGNALSYFSSQPWDVDNNSLGDGDSGGSTGVHHLIYGWGINGVNASTAYNYLDADGRPVKTTAFGSWYARPKYHYQWIMDTVDDCRVVYLGDGYALQCW